MDHRLRPGHFMCLIGAGVLVFALFAPWYALTLPPGFADSLRGAFSGTTDPFGSAFGQMLAAQVDQIGRSGISLTAWDAFEFLDVLLLVAAGATALIVGLALADRLSRPVDDILAAIGGIAVVGVVFRLVAQPGPAELLDLRYGAGMALAGAMAIVVGARVAAGANVSIKN